jgi:hypothetical protein
MDFVFRKLNLHCAITANNSIYTPHEYNTNLNNHAVAYTPYSPTELYTPLLRWIQAQLERRHLHLRVPLYNSFRSRQSVLTLEILPQRPPNTAYDKKYHQPRARRRHLVTHIISLRLEFEFYNMFSCRDLQRAQNVVCTKD